MATEDPCEFGPQAFSEQINPRDMNKAEYEAYKSKRDEEKKLIRKGYDRIKEKIKSVRQDYRAAVNLCSGKIVQDNYDLLTTFGVDLRQQLPCLSGSMVWMRMTKTKLMW
jgi:hypothetical protein